MKIKPHSTKFPFNVIMSLTFGLSKLLVNKPNNNSFNYASAFWPTNQEELNVFFNYGTYSFDPGHGIINMVVHPDQAKTLVIGDCDDYAAKLYALCLHKEKYLLTYFTHDLKKWHTVFVGYDNKTDKYNVINGSQHDKSNDFYSILDILKKYSNSPWYDYHLSYFDTSKKKGTCHK